jgi:hypothetical protein
MGEPSATLTGSANGGSGSDTLYVLLDQQFDGAGWEWVRFD